jgi:hypothetical protein
LFTYIRAVRALIRIEQCRRALSEHVQIRDCDATVAHRDHAAVTKFFEHATYVNGRDPEVIGQLNLR